MGKALESRLNGNEKEFLEDIENYGRPQTLRLWEGRLDGYRDPIGLQRFLDKIGKPNLGLSPQYSTINPEAGRTVVEEFCERLEYWVKNRITPLEETVRQQNEYIALIEKELEAYRRRDTIALNKGIKVAMEAFEK